eukprot:1196547-Alexandrium_andersonii.AAC.1
MLRAPPSLEPARVTSLPGTRDVFTGDVFLQPNLPTPTRTLPPGIFRAVALARSLPLAKRLRRRRPRLMPPLPPADWTTAKAPSGLRQQLD